MDDLHLLKLKIPFTEFSEDITVICERATELYNRKVDSAEQSAFKADVQTWKKMTSDYLKECFNIANNSIERGFYEASNGGFNLGFNTSPEQVIKNQKDEIAAKHDYLVGTLAEINVFDSVKNELNEPVGKLTVEEKLSVILDKLFLLYGNTSHNIAEILAGNGIVLDRYNEEDELLKILETSGYVERAMTGLGKAYCHLTVYGKMELEKQMEADKKKQSSNNNSDKPKKIFISHSSHDKDFVGDLIEVIERIGVRSDQIFCSSFEGYGIELGEDFLARLKSELNENVLVLFILSENFYKSPVSLCEMGATWVKTNTHIPILIPPLDYSDVKGVIPNTQGFKINEKFKLNSFKEKLEKEFGLTPISNSIWEKKRDNFIITTEHKLKAGI